MPARALEVSGQKWDVYPSGYITQYTQDEYGLLFSREVGDKREVRVTRYSPQGARSRERAFLELTDEQLRELFEQSQPSFTSPEAGYGQ
ncbi:MAG: hypothetical protein ABIS15_05935 [Gemmatimonadaceae bacterium]|jgi:hypothetical protein